ncbi:MAG TPA: c-type cytochrome domain-containing protein [Pirellulales bacterium]|nr:c-type cytochrome domain-containing protein [Pirellulales bacterium]
MSLLFRRLPVLVALLVVAPRSAWSEEAKPAGDAKKKITYADDIQPIFREHCYSCHNQDDSKSDLALHTYGSVMKGGAGGEVVIAGDIDSSRLWHLVSHQEQPKMPPEQDKLPEAKLALIKQWIIEGALENSGSKAKVAKKANLELNTAAGSQKPVGPPPMPTGLFRQPFVTSARGGAITALASSPWAPLVAVGGQKQILLYNSDSGELIGILPFPEGSPLALKFSRNGALLLCGGGRHGQAGRVVLYDVRKGERVAELGEEVDAVLAADISPDHKLVAMGGPRRVVRVYAVEDGSLEYELRKHTDWIYSMEFSPDGKWLATGDRSGGVFLWEAETGREFQNLTGHTAGVTDVTWRIDSKVLATASEDGTVKTWEADTGKVVKSWTAHAGGVLSARFGRNGNIVSSGRDKEVKLWDGQGKQLQTFKGMADQVQEVVLTHDDARVVAGDWTGDIRMWNAKDAVLVAQMIQNPPTLADLLTQQIAEVGTLEADSKRLATEVAATRQSAESAQAAWKQAADKATNAANDLKRLEGEIPALEKQSKALSESARKAVDKLNPLKAEATKLDNELASLKKQKKDAKDDAAKNSDLDKREAKLAESRAQLEKRIEADRQAIHKLRDDQQALDKQRGEKAAKLKSLKASLPGLKAEADKLAQAKTAAEKALAEKVAASDACSKRATALRAGIDRTRAEKDAYEKAHTQQASAVR